MLYALDGVRPDVDPDGTWVAPTASVIGKVKMEARASVWFGATLRGDNEFIHLGEGTNVQDGAILHTDPGCPLTLGKNVTVGHQVMLHGCSIGDSSLIGMGATILNRAVVGKQSIVGAGALITEGKEFEDGVLIIGSPARVARQLNDSEKALLEKSATLYIANAARFSIGLEAVTT